jgi:GntR family transcriptional regulator, transcriptional repressor for pyruvate dehydrogenase complex
MSGNLLAKAGSGNRKSLVTPIQKVDLTEEVIKKMKALMESGELRAGSKLPPERELAEMLGISRPSLRQALKALSVMGILKSQPGQGTFVTDEFLAILSEPLQFMMLLKENLPFTELFEARTILETKMARMAAMRASEEDLRIMEQSLGGMKENLDFPKGFVEHEIRFHQAIIDAAGNTLLSTVMGILYKLLNDYREKAAAVLDNLDEMYECHFKIYEEIAKSNPEGAERAADQHFVYSEIKLRERGLVLGNHTDAKPD